MGAKCGGGRFRLFFRYSTSAKIIVFAWVNDETTLRIYGSKSDAYAVFRKMLDKGNPHDDWAAASEPHQGFWNGARAPIGIESSRPDSAAQRSKRSFRLSKRRRCYL